MAILLNIDTAVDIASVCLSDRASCLRLLVNENQKDHAAWLHPAIQRLLQDSGMTEKDLEGVVISIGPGSYTGLRVGLSAAKGICYALNIPLIAIGTLKIMAQAVNNEEGELFCPLIDAKRMEVFTAIYDRSLIEINKPSAMVIDEYSFAELLATNKVLFCGNGCNKLQTVLFHDNARFSNTIATAACMPFLATEYFKEKKFADLAYLEPLYVKEFYSPSR